MPLLRLLARLVARRALAVAGFALGLLVVSLVGASAQVETAPAPAPLVVPQDAPLSPAAVRVERLLARHDCWTGAAPADRTGQVPGGVVVTAPGGAPHLSARWVGPALEQVLGERDHRLVVHAFCA
ncbi:hypothetical protein [Nocardioides nanhaiensis]|uniref:Uncharacterized protein n=1 Tax=Nocardioides nanhaiensis TaxID=1476871 RepID=A0ABP8W7V6_9ACTN